jgi:hypothetical protein
MVRLPKSARAVPRLAVVMVLPVPPFPEAIVNTFVINSPTFYSAFAP